jgi:nitrite reductase (cytochrome c-552)
LKARVETIQDRTFQMRNAAMDAVVELIADLKAARASGVATNDPALLKAQEHHRRAQWFLDFVEAENSMGFHAPQEAARLLSEAINEARKGQVAIRDRR